MLPKSGKILFRCVKISKLSDIKYTWNLNGGGNLLYIFWGEDNYSRDEALQEIKNKLGDMSLLATNTSVFEGHKINVNELKMCTEALPFLAEKRLVIIKGLLEYYETRSSSKQTGKSSVSASKNDEAQALIDCLNKVPQTTIVILTDYIENKKSALTNNRVYKGIVEKAETRQFPLLKGPKLFQWVQDRVNEKGGSISRQATDILIQFVGSDLFTLNNEIDKLVAFSSGRQIEEKDIRMVVSAAKEADVFNLVDAIVDQKLELAENILQTLLKNGIAPPQILSLIARQIQLMVQIKDLKSQKKTTAEMQTKTGINYGFIWEKTSARADKYTLDDLKVIYKKLLETDLAIKTGKIEGELALDILVADLGFKVC
jgi:DNA polymerase III subunit delta